MDRQFIEIRNKAPAAVFFLFLFLMQALLNYRLDILNGNRTVAPVETTARWNSDFFKAITFGHWPAGVDWLWIKTLTDPSISHVKKGVHPPIYYDLELATDLDPAFYDLYINGANLLAVIRDDGEGARELLLKGDAFRKKDLPLQPESLQRTYWSSEWQLPLLLAYVYLFELNDMPNAAIQFKTTANLPGAPAYLAHLSQRFSMPGGEYEVGLRLLNFLIGGEKDERAKSLLEQKRASLYLAQYISGLNRSFDRFLRSLPAYPVKSEIKKYWLRFMKESGNSLTDPFGGALSINERARIVSSTPHQKVFGLE